MKKQSLIIDQLSSFKISNVQKVIPLYDKKAPNSKDINATDIFLNETEDFQFITTVHTPDLTVFLPEKSLSTGIAVVICPGGAYVGLSIDNEGYDIAKKLNEKGIAGFVLKYRLPKAEYVNNKQIVPLQDAQRAIQLIRENAKKWGINPNKIGIAGSSAGGHLASTAGTHFHKEYIDNPLKTSLRPDFMILNYPVISMADSLTHVVSRYSLIGEGLAPKELNLIVMDRKTSVQKLVNLPIDLEKIKEFSNELQVSPNTPPTFITHSVDDNSVKVENSILFIAALQKNKVPVESFFYVSGGHGYGTDNPTSDVDWIDSCVTWVLKMF
ncbi:beta-xylanase [Flavobacterium palustre]|uniref:Beta-xylanase n=1 Tax=Flavobacterium palustre TaxID=1476463 RepID=A0ABQ1HMV0_9FLAO|nr:alpha/beta hydrolase [Flavobacterium palustre]GGA82232.1 beta-xylanase [Flavobacterium palustre]